MLAPIFTDLAANRCSSIDRRRLFAWAAALFLGTSIASSDVHAQGRCDDPEFPLAGCEGRPLMFPKAAPGSVGGRTPETLNLMSPSPLMTDASRIVRALMETGVGQNGVADVNPIAMKSCTGVAARPQSTQLNLRYQAPTQWGQASAITDRPPPGPATSSETANGTSSGAAPQVGTQGTRGSYVDNLRWSFVHTAIDYSFGPDANDCSCGCSPITVAGNAVGQLQHLALKRIHRPQHAYVLSSFGLGVFSPYDTKIQLNAQGQGVPLSATFYDVDSDSGYVTFYDSQDGPGEVSGDGILNEPTTRLYKSVELLNSSGNHVPTIDQAVTAVVTAQTGERWVFEVIDTAGIPGVLLDGRLIRKEDRNGNAEIVTYAFAASASGTALGNDRTKLWQIQSVSDPYGASLGFHYININGRWSVSQVDLPDGTHFLYGYATNNPGAPSGEGMTLSSVTYPVDNSANPEFNYISTFSVSVDNRLQELVLAFVDNGATEGGIRQSIYLTQSTIFDDGALVTQPPNVARAVLNGEQELVYRNYETNLATSSSRLNYIFEAPGKLTRITKDNSGYPVEIARAISSFDPGSDPHAATFEVIESYQSNSASMMTARFRPDGYTRTYARDLTTRAIADATFPGNVTTSATYNAFRQPTMLIDTKGASHKFTYDAKGNVTSAMIAAGTTTQATWSMTYNGRGQPLTSTDANGHLTNYTYDTAGRLTAITEPPDTTGGTRAVRKFGYDSVARVSSATDANGRIVKFEYDRYGRLHRTVYPNLDSENVVYGFNLNVVVETDSRNRIQTNYDYDNATRLVKETYFLALTGVAAITTGFSYVSGTHIVSQKNEAGESRIFEYDQRNRLISTTTPTSNANSLIARTTWDSLDRKVMETDNWGRRSYFVYDGKDRIIRKVRELVAFQGPPLNPSTLVRDLNPNPTFTIEEFEYDNPGNLTKENKARGSIDTYQYDQQGRRTQMVVASGTSVEAKTQYSYDAMGDLLKVIRPRTFTSEGNGVESFRDEMTYNGRNLLASRTEAVGRPSATVVTKLTYTLTGQKATKTDGAGKVTSYVYDNCCDRLMETHDPAGFVTKYLRDGVGNLTAVTNPLGNKTTFAYDGLNRLTSTTNPAMETETIEYDDNLTDGVGFDDVASGLNFQSGVTDGAATRLTKANGETTTLVFDSLHRVVRELNGALVGARDDRQAVTTQYDGRAAVGSQYDLITTIVTDGLNQVTVAQKDGNDVIRAVVDAESQVTNIAVDAFGKVLSQRDPTGVGFNCTFDERERETSCTDTQGSTTSTTFDVENNRKTRVDALGKTVAFSYDGRGRKTSMIDELGKTTSYAYDGADRLIKLTDAESKATQYQYDARGLMTKQIYSDAGSVTNTYDAGGRLSTSLNQLNQTIKFTYDAADRLTGRTYPDGLNDSFQYDKASRLIGAQSTRYDNFVGRTYDTVGRLIQEFTNVAVVGTQRENFTTTYLYDVTNRITDVFRPHGTDSTRRVYNKRGDLTFVDMGFDISVGYGLDAAGRPTSAFFRNGLIETTSFRADGLASSVKLTNSSGNRLLNLAYDYDANKRRTGETNLLASNETQAFSYDVANRLTSWNQGTNSQSWSLSAVGNWSTVNRNGTAETRTHGLAHEIKTVNSIGLTTDARGSTTKDDKSRTYTWDFDNQLKSTKDSAGLTVSFTYDALGRRLTKTNGSIKTVIVSEGDKENARTLEEYENGVWKRSYLYGTYTDEVIAMRTDSNLYYYTHNNNYSVQMLTDSNGAVAEQYRYDAYGKRTVLNASGTVLNASAIQNRVGFTGRIHDETGLVFFRSRYYQPRLGRFISRDTAFVDGPNLYRAYFAPLGLDPTGHESFADGLVRGWRNLKTATKVEILGTAVCIVLGVAVKEPLWGRTCAALVFGYTTGDKIWEAGNDPNRAETDSPACHKGDYQSWAPSGTCASAGSSATAPTTGTLPPQSGTADNGTTNSDSQDSHKCPYPTVWDAVYRMCINDGSSVIPQ